MYGQLCLTDRDKQVKATFGIGSILGEECYLKR